MNWEETIQFIRTQSEYNELVKDAYFDEDLSLNVERFRSSEEYKETLRLLHFYAPNAVAILDIGSGNGISPVAFALEGYKVTVTEPDPSDTVGAGAVRELKKQYGITTMDVFQDFAENIKFGKNFFDVVYIRQAMHHANDLTKFIAECARVLKPGGILFTVRDHVIFNEEDKQQFLNGHPLQKFYGGENAFTPAEYKMAMEGAGLLIRKEMKYYDSVINYYPRSVYDLKKEQDQKAIHLKIRLKKKLGILAHFPFVLHLYKLKNKSSVSLNEKDVPGRMYSYIAQKK